MAKKALTSMSDRDSRIDEMQLALKGVEGRVEIGLARQKAIEDRAEELYAALNERLSAKDGIVELLREQAEWTLKQNDTLLKQIGLRWNLLTGFTGLVALSFSIVFAYQIWRVEQVMATKSALEQSAAAATESAKVLTENTRKYSDILGILAQADTLMTDSNREFLRSEYVVAAKRAGAAVEALRVALQDTGEPLDDLDKRRSLYSSESCSLAGYSSAASIQAATIPDSGLSPKALRRAIRDALFTALDLHARASFFSARDNVRNDGLSLLALDELQWHGYHWLGLAAEDNHVYSEATKCFRHSIDKNQVGNKDYVNLAELSFIGSNFGDAVSYADQYLHPLNHRFKTSLDVIAQFYFSAAGFLTHATEPSQRMPPSSFVEGVKKLGPDFTLEGTFSTKDLDEYLKSEPFGKLPDEQKSGIKKLTDCLESRRCGD
jgi:hypothetical protein